MLCRFRDYSKILTAAQDLKGAYFCKPSHRSAEYTARRHHDEANLRAGALDVIRKITTAHLVGDEARILALASEAERLLQPRT